MKRSDLSKNIIIQTNLSKLILGCRMFGKMTLFSQIPIIKLTLLSFFFKSFILKTYAFSTTKPIFNTLHLKSAFFFKYIKMYVISLGANKNIN